MSAITSLKVFRSYIHYGRAIERGSDGTAPASEMSGDVLMLDATQIHSKACFEEWLASRGGKGAEITPEQQYKRFYRALSNHVSGVDGRTPFPQREEEAILLVLRDKKRWPCFPEHIHLGESGFRAKGFHEKQARKRLKQQEEVEEDAGTHEYENEQLDEADQAYVDSLVSQFPAFITSYRAFSVDVWAKVINILRLICLAKSPAYFIGKRRPDCYAEELCARKSLELGQDYFVLVYDALAQEYSKRILAQNELGVWLFGDLVQKMNRILIHQEEINRVLFSCMWVIHKPGQVFWLPRLSMVCADAIVRSFDVQFCLDADSFFVMTLCGKAVGSRGVISS